MYEFIVNVQVAVVRDGRYLFIVRGDEEEYLPGVMGLPGGKAENGDVDNFALEDAGRREVEEETGAILGPSLHYVRSNIFSGRVMNVLLIAKWDSGEPFARSQAEVERCVWLTAEEVAAERSIPDWEQQHILHSEPVRRRLNW